VSEPAERLILALDRPDAASALALAAAIPELRWVKVVLELLLPTGGGILSQSGWGVVVEPGQRVR